MRERKGKSAFLGGVRDLTLNVTIIALCVILVAFIWNFVNTPNNDIAGDGVTTTPPLINTMIDREAVDAEDEPATQLASNETEITENEPVPLQRVYKLDLRNGTMRNGFAGRYEKIIEDHTNFNILKPTNASSQDHKVTIIHDYGVDSQSIKELQNFLGLGENQIIKKSTNEKRFFGKLILGDDAVDFPINN